MTEPLRPCDLSRFDSELEVCEEPWVIAVGRELYEVLATSEDGCLLIYPLGLMLTNGIWRDKPLDKAGRDVLELKREGRAE